jgi:hypothetical protein
MVAEKRKREFSLIWHETRRKKSLTLLLSSWVPVQVNLFHSLRFAIPVTAGGNPSLGHRPDYCRCQKARITKETLLTKINGIQMLDYIVTATKAENNFLYNFKRSCNSSILFLIIT